MLLVHDSEVPISISEIHLIAQMTDGENSDPDFHGPVVLVEA